MFSVCLLSFRPLSSLRHPILAIAVFATVLMATFSSASPMNRQAWSQDKVDFAREIKPLFENRCLRCHGPEEQDGDFRIDQEDMVLNYLDPGDAAFSDLFDSVSTDEEERMMPPPEEGGPLASEEIDLIRRWINEGAEWPEAVTLEMPTAEVQEELATEIANEKIEKDKTESSWQLLWEILGLLHPVLLHFPVAMIIGGALFAIVGFRGESPLSDAAYYCLWLGALSAVLACGSGWSFAIYKNYLNWQSLDFNNSIDVHRWGGILIAALAFLLALVASSSRRRDPYGTGAFWKISLILLAGLTGYVAHHGGKLTHKGLHDDLNSKTTILYKNVAGQSEAERLDKENQQQEKEMENKAESKSGDSGEGNAETSNDEKDGKADEAGETDKDAKDEG